MYTEGRTEEDFECPFYLSLPNALEAGSLTESGARQTGDKAQPSSCLCLPQLWDYRHAASFLCGCWGLELRFSCFTASALLH